MSPQASSTLPVGSASADSWDEVIDTRAGVPINELIDGLDDIAALAIPYARLPRRAYNVFSAEFRVVVRHRRSDRERTAEPSEGGGGHRARTAHSRRRRCGRLPGRRDQQPRRGCHRCAAACR